MKKIVRINVPENAGKLIVLAQNIITKHQQDGVDSPLKYLNMVDMQAKITIADTQHNIAEQKSKDAETATEDRDIVLGSYKGGIMPGTVMHYITWSRDILLGIYKGNEHHLGDWSFEVNTSGGGVKVIIPANAPDLIKLAKGILAKHQADGANSPLNNLNTADMQTKTNAAETKHNLAKTLKEAAEEAIQKRDLALGHANEQSTYTPSTVVFFVSSARDILLGIYRGNERELNKWGFNVDSSLNGSTPPPPATVAIRAVSSQAPPFQTITIEIAGTAGKQGTINWGDGTIENYTMQGNFINLTHTYTTAGDKTIIISENTDSIDEFQSMTCKLISLEFPDNMRPIAFRLSNNQLSAPVLPDAVLVNLRYVFLDSNNLTEQFVNDFLIRMNTLNTATGSRQIFLNDGTNAAPSGQGVAAKNQLIGKGWQVTTN